MAEVTGAMEATVITKEATTSIAVLPTEALTEAHTAAHTAALTDTLIIMDGTTLEQHIVRVEQGLEPEPESEPQLESEPELEPVARLTPQTMLRSTCSSTTQQQQPMTLTLPMVGITIMSRLCTSTTTARASRALFKRQAKHPGSQAHRHPPHRATLLPHHLLHHPALPRHRLLRHQVPAQVLLRVVVSIAASRLLLDYSQMLLGRPRSSIWSIGARKFSSLDQRALKARADH